VFYIDVAKVDRDIANVVRAIHVCFKCMFQIFYLFQTYIASVSSRYCKYRFGCCIYIFMCFKCFHTYVASVFHLDVAMFVMDKHVFFKFFWCFVNVLDVCCKCFSYFRRMLQVFHLNVAKVDRMLHMLNETHLTQLPTAVARACCWRVAERVNAPHVRSSGAALCGHAK
jgi:hypothetical protein